MISSCYQHMAMIPFFSLKASTFNTHFYLPVLSPPMSFMSTSLVLHFRHSYHQQYYYFYSCCHPSSTKCSIPFSKPIYGRHICNHLNKLSNFSSNLTIFYCVFNFVNISVLFGRLLCHSLVRAFLFLFLFFVISILLYFTFSCGLFS